MAVIPIAGVFLDRAALATGFLAAAIAVGGFIARSQAVLRDRSEPEVQGSLAVGGLHGLSLGLMVIVFDAVAG